jgi:hypothetical protein
MKRASIVVLFLAVAAGCSQGPGTSGGDAVLPANARSVSFHVPEMS